MVEKTTISTTRMTFHSKLRPHLDTSRTRAFLVRPRRAHRTRLYTTQKVDA